MDSITDLVSRFPKISSDDLVEISNVITQSALFTNHLNDDQPTNSFELDYAVYLCDGNQEFLDRYRSIVEEACFREFLEWYEYISKNILDKEVQEVLGYTLDATDTDWVSKVKKSNIFGWALHVKDKKTFIQNSEKAYQLGLIMRKFFNDRTRPLSTMDDDYFESDHAQLVLDSIQKIIIQDDKKYLQSHTKCDKILCMIEVYGWENMFNPVLLQWIYNNRDRVSKWI